MGNENSADVKRVRSKIELAMQQNRVNLQKKQKKTTIYDVIRQEIIDNTNPVTDVRKQLLVAVDDLEHMIDTLKGEVKE